MSAAAEARWPEAAHGFSAEGLDAFLLWAADRGASDIAFQTGSPAFVEIDGRLRRATDACLDGVVMGRLCERLYDATGEGILRAGRAIDCSHAIRLARGLSRRFRCNLAPVQAETGFAVNITLRVLPGRPPSFAELGIEDEIVGAWDLCKGLTLVTGVPGSGKSTLLAAGTRRLLERGAGRIQSYEGADRIRLRRHRRRRRADVVAEIPRHFPSFAEGLRSSLRRGHGGDRGRGARPRDHRRGGARGRLRDRCVLDDAHHRGRRHRAPHAGRVPRGGAGGTGRRADRRHDAGGNANAAAQPGRRTHGAPRMACLRRTPQGGAAGEPAGDLGRDDRAALAKTGNDLAASAGRARRAGKIGEDSYRRILAGSERSVP